MPAPKKAIAKPPRTVKEARAVIVSMLEEAFGEAILAASGGAPWEINANREAFTALHQLTREALNELPGGRILYYGMQMSNIADARNEAIEDLEKDYEDG